MPLPVPRLTIDMLDDLPEDGTRYELLEGVLLVTPAPSFAHQVVATRLASMLTSALVGSDATVVAVGAIQRGKHTQLQPDLLVCPPGLRPTASWRDIRDWWLAAEVLSPSSRLYDREVKRGAYLALGVQEYWIVDPDSCSVERWRDLVAIGLGSGLRQAAAGLAVGIVAALLLTRTLGAMLQGVTPTDPLTFAGVVLVTGAVAVVASLGPARRAGRIAPNVALRAE